MVTQANIDGEGISVRGESEVSVAVYSDSGISAVSGVDIGEEIKQDPTRPSVVLRRAGDSTLWDIAKEYGSTMEAIRSANGLQSEPVANQMLLVPLM